MMVRCWRFFGATILVIAGLGAGPLQADDETNADGPVRGSIATSLPQNGDPAGIRKSLGDHGITYALIYTNDVLSNRSGGNKRGTIDQGKVLGQLTVDLGKLAGWQDLTLYSNAFQIHNTGRMRRDYVGGMNTIAAIEAAPSTRLSELWLEQKFLGGGVSVRVGQLAADSEFFYSDLSGLFMQSDWATITAVNLPSGGPAYPLSTPGARVQFNFGKDVSLLFAVFNGDPAGPGSGDADSRNRYGLNFRLRDRALMIGEAQFRLNTDKNDTGLSSRLKLGAWRHLGQFDDQRYANDGSLLADPAGSGTAAKRRNDFGVYGIIDQQLYRLPHGAADSGVSVFSRASLSPSDRNLVDKYIDGGIVFAGFIPNRPADSFGASVIYARFSDSVRAFDQDQINFGTIPGPIRDYETNLELTYVAQIIPGWIVQPNFQFIWHPSGQAGHDAKVMGIRSMLKF